MVNGEDEGEDDNNISPMNLSTKAKAKLIPFQLQF